MKVVADSDIPLVKDAFVQFGEVLAVAAREITPGLLADAEILVVRSVTPVNEALVGETGLRFVASATSGVDHVDIEFLRSRGIGFAAAPGCNADSVAQYVIAALLHLARQRGRRLQELTLGVIGAGNVGSCVRRCAGALGMRCVLNDPPKERCDAAGTYAPLFALLDESDIVTLHVPLSRTGPDPTYHLAGAEFVGRMRGGAVLINTSRGAVADETALRAARERLGGLVIDVWENEPRVSVETAACADIATPHIAGYSLDAKMRATSMIHAAACRFFAREAAWKPSRLPSPSAGRPVDLTKTTDPVDAAVAAAYPIMLDDERMREAMRCSAPRRAAAFEELRRSYPLRREFGGFTVALNARDRPEAADTLRGIGFAVQEPSPGAA